MMKERYSKASQASILSSNISQVSTLFLAKTTQSPAPSSSTVTTHTPQVFSTPAHFRYCREIHRLIKKVTLASFIAGRGGDEEDNRLSTEKEFLKFSVLISMLLCLRRSDDTVERNICKLCIKMQIRGTNYK